MRCILPPPPRNPRRSGHVYAEYLQISPYMPRTKEVIKMPEQDERQTAAPQAGGKEDVDDLIFRTAPGWLVSDR